MPSRADAYAAGTVASVATGHTGFAILNRAVSPLVEWLLRSPLHWPASRRLVLITYTGRGSGRPYTIPVRYEVAGLQVTITVGSPHRKLGGDASRAPGRRSSRLSAAAGRTGHAVATQAGDEALVPVALNR